MDSKRKTAKLSNDDHKFLKLLAAQVGSTVEKLLADAVALLRKKHKS